jgi:hypothetical protein
MDGVIDFTALSLDIPPAADTPAAGSTGTSLFATPLSTCSGSTGGDRFGSSVGLFYCREVSSVSVCRGVIAKSGNNRFCLKATCEIKSHRNQKVMLAPDSLYILGTRKDQALLEPSLKGTNIPEGTTIADLLTKDRPVDVWKAFFASETQRISADDRADATSEVSWFEVDPPTLEKLSTVANSYATPQKLRVGGLLEAFADSIPIGVGNATELSAIPDLSTLQGEEQDIAGADAIQTILREWNVLRDNIILFNDEFAKLGVGETKYRNAISDSVMRIHDAMRDTDARICLLAVRVGSDNTEASDSGTDSIWESIRKIYDTTRVIRDDLDVTIGHYSDSVQANDDIVDKMAVLDQNFKGLHQFSQDNLTKLMERVRVLESKRPRGGSSLKGPDNRAFMELIGVLESDVKRNSQTIQESNATTARLSTDVNVLKRKFKTLEEDRLEEDFGRLESRIDGLESESPGSEVGVGGGGVARISAITDELDRLTERMDRADSRGPDESFEMEDFSYNSYIDFRKFLLLEKVPSCGMYWDLFSCLVSMKPKGLTGKQRADEQHSSERIKTSMFENNLLAAMGHARPSCLYGTKGGEGALVDSDKGFGACLSYDKWRAGVDSVKKVLTKELKAYTTGVSGNMLATDGGGALAKQLLISVKEQWYELVNWMDEFYKQLTEEANFKAEPAWRLVGRCVASVFDRMSDHRAKVALLEDPTPLESKAKLIWCVLQCHMVMERFIAVKFQGDPVIVKEITMFMVTERVDPDELVKLQKELDKTTGALRSCTSSLDSLESKFLDLKRAFDNHIANGFKNLKDKVHARS